MERREPETRVDTGPAEQDLRDLAAPRGEGGTGTERESYQPVYPIHALLQELAEQLQEERTLAGGEGSTASRDHYDQALRVCRALKRLVNHDASLSSSQKMYVLDLIEHAVETAGPAAFTHPLGELQVALPLATYLNTCRAQSPLSSPNPEG